MASIRTGHGRCVPAPGPASVTLRLNGVAPSAHPRARLQRAPVSGTITSTALGRSATHARTSDANGLVSVPDLLAGPATISSWLARVRCGSTARPRPPWWPIRKRAVDVQLQPSWHRHRSGAARADGTTPAIATEVVLELLPSHVRVNASPRIRIGRFDARGIRSAAWRCHLHDTISGGFALLPR